MPLGLPAPADLPVPVNLGIFALAAVAVWFAGVRLARTGDVLADRIGLGKAVFGLVFLAVATSLPEISTTLTAAGSGNASLATSNLLGGVVLQTGVLVIADGVIRHGPLTYFAPRPILLLQGTLLILLLSLALTGIVAGEVAQVGWIGLWSVVLAAGYVVMTLLLRAYRGSDHWRPVDIPPRARDQGDEDEAEQGARARSTPDLALRFGASAGLVLVAGIVLATVADAIARQTGLGQSLVGSTLLAGSTSLPEISTTVTAVRLGSYALAISNMFGSNALMVGLLFVADAAFLEGPILESVDRAAALGAAAGIVATAIYLAGLIERRDRQVWRLGLDSIAMVVLFVVYLGVLSRVA